MTSADLLLAAVITERALNKTEARALVNSIKTDVADVSKRIEVAFLGRSWLALGYANWDAMCEAEFDGARLRIPREQRVEQVQSLRAAGLSTRAIGAAMGVDDKTVRNDLAGAEKSAPDVVGKDGKRYAPSQPPRPQSSPPSAAAPVAPERSPDGGGEPTREEFLAQRGNGEVVSPEEAAEQPEPSPLARARAEVAGQPATVAQAGIDHLRRARKSFTTAGPAAVIAADLDNDELPDGDRGSDWLSELDKALPVLNALHVALRRRNLRSVKP